MNLSCDPGDDESDDDDLTDEEVEEFDKGFPDYDGSGEPEQIDRDNDPPDSENPWQKSP